MEVEIEQNDKAQIAKTKKTVLLTLAIVIVFTIAVPLRVQAQQDTTQNSSNSTSVQEHSPLKAVVLSAIVPGLGQAYNRKLWKVPLIYAGFGSLIYFADYNAQKYDTFSRYYANSQVKGPIELETGGIEAKGLQVRKKHYKRMRDLTYIMIAGLYVLNIIDASVDAHMFYYDVSKDLSFRVEPAIFQINKEESQTMGIRLALQF